MNEDLENHTTVAWPGVAQPRLRSGPRCGRWHSDTLALPEARPSSGSPDRVLSGLFPVSLRSFVGHVYSGSAYGAKKNTRHYSIYFLYLTYGTLSYFSAFMFLFPLFTPFGVPRR